MREKRKNVAIIVAHPDDETLWVGGTILKNRDWQCFIACLCRKNDLDRAPKFEKVLNILGAKGVMGDMDDSPEQRPLPDVLVEESILELLPSTHFDLIITHSIYGEYTRHRRHEEIGKAIINLWHSALLTTSELWTFAFEDHQKANFPTAIKKASIFYSLPQEIWENKYSIVTNTYGFNPESWEAKTTPKEEAFWRFLNADQAYNWLAHK
ncbi:N-acetylglucosaminyl deacetylase, LmbE family [Mucilaginibacter lappiensis]|uniref:LmbE family N-acetylglucosaminyl deacetylase n=1 Tax=Mucilaginibacter lappiensis TaxID=354630 RepID=A0ABR6PQL5_9SPHI|nr:PIG-L family deacetylase [Mucilaginibacter lappiensis]MBB6112015.1 LmbE family N-acetylglucosaminyl deacetylase [Mucilaginibacter lappiensis]SIR92020.1 N-acetylglucosaminyl deacetylase, LmbE family [Mucilaginibacter lappiensis]